MHTSEFQAKKKITLMDNLIDKIIVVASISLLFSLYGTVAVNMTSDITKASEAATEATGEPEEHYSMSSYHHAYLWHTKFKVMMYSVRKSYEYETAGTFEEEVSEEMNCLFYATIPIGKYYITAYNHKETGSKITASGKTCHEGTITTCAADPRYHKFGEYLEIVVDGQPRLFRVEDTGGMVKKKHIDIYFYDYGKMAKYGSNYQYISRVEFPFGKPNDD